MKRRIIEIDRDKCNGCGACAAACHEGAIAMVDGKAKLMRDDYCDGLGDCLPTCPTGAISFVEREAAAYDEQAVMLNKQQKMREQGVAIPHAGCPGSRPMELTHDAAREGHVGCPGAQSRSISHEAANDAATHSADCHDTHHHDASHVGCPSAKSRLVSHEGDSSSAPAPSASYAEPVSRLSQWPVQIKLVPVKAPYFDGAKLLIAADCTAYAYAAFHERFIKGHITLIGCPKLDDVDYSEKLTEIIRENDIKSVTIVRMEVPCCGGLQNAAVNALKASGKFIPWQLATISIDGRILD